MRALIVDDSDDLRELIAVIVQGLGFDVFRAADGRAALDLLGKQGPMDVVLTDLYMPVMDGFELVKALRADRAYDRMPVLLVTTETGQAHVQKALSLGANEYVMKPFTRDMIQTKLKMVGVLRD